MACIHAAEYLFILEFYNNVIVVAIYAAYNMYTYNNYVTAVNKFLVPL